MLFDLGIYTIISALIIVTLCERTNGDLYCLATDGNPYLYFATKTSYQFVFFKRLQQPIPGCTPVQIWMLARHGTSYPSWEKLKNMSDLRSFRNLIIMNHENRRNGELCSDDRDALHDWKWSVPFDNAGKLTEQGVLDQVFLAKRLKTHFKEILEATYTPLRFSFKLSDKGFTKGSAQAFAEELFGRETPIYFSDENIDPYLAVENCDTLYEHLHNPGIDSEAEKFKREPLATSLVHSVSKRLGFLYNLTFDSVLDIYDLCRYEKAWNYSATSPWCAAFSSSDLMILEYYEDLKNYYRYGYGNDLSLKYGCPLVKDLMQNFDKVAKNETDVPTGIFYFAEKEILMSVIIRLGMANDKKALPAVNLDLSKVTEKKQWRTSFISPFAGNIAAVFYKCNRDDEPNKIMFFINEHTIEYEGCNVGLCSWSYIRDRFSRIVNSEECSNNFCNPIMNSVKMTISSDSFLFITIACIISMIM